jgi:hypothetical protein
VRRAVSRACERSRSRLAIGSASGTGGDGGKSELMRSPFTQQGRNNRQETERALFLVVKSSLAQSIAEGAPILERVIFPENVVCF